MDDAYKMINQTLVSLINEIWELEEKAIITDEFKDLTNNDMHVIEAVGLGLGLFRLGGFGLFRLLLRPVLVHLFFFRHSVPPFFLTGNVGHHHLVSL